MTSHKGDHSGFSEMLLGRENIGGGGGRGSEDGKCDHDGFAEILYGYEILGGNNATFDGGNGLTLVSGRDLVKAI